MNHNITISPLRLSQALTIIGLIIGGWLLLEERFVNNQRYKQDQLDNAKMYQRDQLVIQGTFVELQLDIIENRMVRARSENNEGTLISLTRRYNLLEKKQNEIMKMKIKI